MRKKNRMTLSPARHTLFAVPVIAKIKCKHDTKTGFHWIYGTD